MSDLLGLAPVNNDVEKLSSVKTLQCGEFKYPDVSSPLCKILAPTKERGHGPLFDLSPGKPDDFPPLHRGGLSVSPYNPNFDEVFQLSSRTPDVSPFRYQPQQQRFGDHGRQRCVEVQIFVLSYGFRDLYFEKNQKLYQNQSSKWKNFAKAKY